MAKQDDLAIFCENVRLLMEQNELTKKEMAEICGIGIKTLSQILQGTISQRVTVTTVYNLSAHFNIKPSQLFTPL